MVNTGRLGFRRQTKEVLVLAEDVVGRLWGGSSRFGTGFEPCLAPSTASKNPTSD